MHSSCRSRGRSGPAVPSPFIASAGKSLSETGMFPMESVMRTNASRWIAGVAMTSMLAGCVAPPPRHTTYYDHGNTGYYDHQGGYYDRERVYDEHNRDRAYDDRSCYQCGRVTDVERVYAREHGTSGGG